MQTLKYIAIIAHNTFRESIRDKILYNIVFLAIALTLFSIVLGEWSVFDRAYVIKSTTLSVMSLSGLLISIFVGISLVQKEIQRRTVLTLLSKPISRVTFIVGKYFGLLAVVAVHLTLLTKPCSAFRRISIIACACTSSRAKRTINASLASS